MKAHLCLCALAGLAISASAATADIVYSSTVQTGSRATGFGAGVVNFDDTFVTLASLNGETSLRVTSVTVGIRRLAGAPAVDATIWWANMVGTSLATSAVGTASALTTTSLAANATTITQLVTLSNPAGLFDVTPNQGIADAAGFAGFYIGLQMDSATSNLNGWRITSGGPIGASSGNGYQYNIADPTNPALNGQYNFGPAPQPGANFFITVDATPFTVPTPGAVGLASLGLLAAARRRR
ncbi:MAG: hypothetical protein ACT4PL_02835 [Phycisphaerales bacterium]